MFFRFRNWLAESVSEHLRGKTAFFLLCYFAVGIVDCGLVKFVWALGGKAFLLGFGWPLYLAAILIQFMQPTDYASDARDIHGEHIPDFLGYSVIYGIYYAFGIALLCLLPTILLINAGLRAEKRRQGARLILFALLFASNVAFFILAQ